jgi:hypothetical protein
LLYLSVGYFGETESDINGHPDFPTNAGHEPLSEAGAQRALEAVGSMPWFGEALSVPKT